MKTKPTERNGEPRRKTQHWLWWCGLPLFAVVLWAGCKQPSPPAADVNPAGTYALVSVDGNNVPCTVQHEGHAISIKSGTFIINADGTCSSLMAFSTSPNAHSSREVKATYTREGPNLTMKWEGAGMTTGKVEGDTFSMNNEGMTLTFRK